jgi:phosphatidate phosphatase LPIN
MKASFGKGGRLELPTGPWGSGSSGSNRKSRMGFGERKGRLGSMALPPVMANSTDAESEEATHEPGQGRKTGGIGRSKSVPPNYLGSPTRKGRRGSREYREYEDVGEHEEEEEEEEEEERELPWEEEKVDENVATKREDDSERRNETSIFGAGGTLSASREDLTMFVLSIEGRKIGFQLSLIPPEGDEDSFSQDEAKGRRGIDNSRTKERPQDEVEAARLFDRYCVDWARFMDDETVVHDQRLIIRWAGNQFVRFLLLVADAPDIPPVGISRERTAHH